MDGLVFFTIISITYNLDGRHATILVKFGYAASHYRNNVSKHGAIIDPLKNFGLHSRQLLCNALINARQFMVKYTPSYYTKMTEGSITSLIDFESLNSDVSINYQKWRPNQKNPEIKDSHYQNRLVRMGQKFTAYAGSIKCVALTTVKWFVTFGFTDKFMYLLELREISKRVAALRVTGLFEPSALIDNRSSGYFHDQFQNFKDKMESICRLGTDDVLRLCSAIFDTLDVKASLKKYLSRTNYLPRHPRRCLVKYVVVDDEVMTTNALRCSITHRETALTLFYVLADPREKGAVFVFKEDHKGYLKLYARVAKVGALINPMGPKEVILQKDENTIEKESKVIAKSKLRSKKKRSRGSKNTTNKDRFEDVEEPDDGEDLREEDSEMNYSKFERTKLLQEEDSTEDEISFERKTKSLKSLMDENDKTF